MEKHFHLDEKINTVNKTEFDNAAQWFSVGHMSSAQSIHGQILAGGPDSGLTASMVGVPSCCVEAGGCSLAVIQPCRRRDFDLAPTQPGGEFREWPNTETATQGKVMWLGPNQVMAVEGGMAWLQPTRQGLRIWKQERMVVLIATASLPLNFPTCGEPCQPNAMPLQATFGL